MHVDARVDVAEIHALVGVETTLMFGLVGADEIADFAWGWAETVRGGFEQFAGCADEGFAERPATRRGRTGVARKERSVFRVGRSRTRVSRNALHCFRATGR